MDKHDLYRQIEALRAELENSEGVSEGAREKLIGLIERLEEQLPDAYRDEGIVEQFESWVTEFEVTHPTLTGVVNDLLVKLSNMGV